MFTFFNFGLSLPKPFLELTGSVSLKALKLHSATCHTDCKCTRF